MRSLVLVSVSAALFAVASSGCSSHETQAAADPSNPCPPGQYCPPPAPTPTMTAPMPTATGTTTAPAAAGGQCTPNAVAQFAGPLLGPIAQTEAPGMQPEGSAFGAQCSEGQTFEQSITLQPGKCYTVIAVSMGVQELHASIAAQPFPNLPATPLAQDNGAAGPQAVVGGKGQCFRNVAPIAVPAKVIVRAARGGGGALAQIYVK